VERPEQSALPLPEADRRRLGRPSGDDGGGSTKAADVEERAACPRRQRSRDAELEAAARRLKRIGRCGLGNEVELDPLTFRADDVDGAFCADD
jgi:hypothetical protein